MPELSPNESSTPTAEPDRGIALARYDKLASLVDLKAAPAPVEHKPQIDRLDDVIDLAVGTLQPIGATDLEQDQAWWRQEAARTGTEWPALLVKRLLELESLCIELQERVAVLEDERSPFARIVEAAPQRQAAICQAERRPRPTPEAVIEAIMYCVRTRRPKALDEPGNQERLRQCDNAALAEIDRRMAKLGAIK
jgi:hypothetical protein